MNAEHASYRAVKRTLVSLLFFLSISLATWMAMLSLPDTRIAATMNTHGIASQSISAGLSTTYPITGQVRLATSPSNPGVEGATIHAGDRYSATTDSNGVYTMTGVLSGTYTLTGVLELGDSCHLPQFTPASRKVSVPPDAVGQDFSVAILIIDPGIEGMVMDANGAPIAGVTVGATGLPAVVTGDSGGFGWFPVECDTTYTVAPFKAGFTFAPPSITFTVPEPVDLHFVGTNQFKHSFLPHIVKSDQSSAQ
jgi:hypothetical protein